jgi:hypothetical protein
MNPKSTANLDPKLREAYERIMGTTVPQPQPKSSEPMQSVSAPTQAPEVKPVTPLQENKPPVNPEPVVNTAPKLEVQEVAPEPINIQTPPQEMPPLPPKEEHPLSEMVPSPQMSDLGNNKDPFVPNPTPQTTNVVNLTNSQTSTTPHKGKSKLMPIILGFGGIGFFVVYAVIWAKVFSLF